MTAPLCKIHNCRMVGHKERVPFAQGTRMPRKTFRTVYRCPLPVCHWVAVGKSDYRPTYEQFRERKGQRFLERL